MRENMKYDTNRYQLRESMLERMLDIIHQQENVQKGNIVFYGDSITEFYNNNKWFEGSINSGIAGITSDMLLNFIDEGVLKFEPQHVVIMIGTNDLGNTRMSSPRDIALNVKEMIEIIHYNLPNCHIHLLSCIPCVEKYHGYQASNTGIRSNDVLKMVFEEYKRTIPYEYVHFVDIFSLFYQDGQLMEDCFVDGLHINEKGYTLISEEIKKFL